MENFKEEFKVKGEEVIGKVKELLHERECQEADYQR